MSTDLFFRVASLPDFMDDLDAFCDANGYPRLTQTDDEGNRTLPTEVTQDHTRYDFDYINDLVGVPAELDSDGNVVSPAIMRGPHINVRISLLPGGDPAELTALQADLDAYFASQSDAPYAPPAAMLARLGINSSQIRGNMKRTGRGTGLIRRSNGEIMHVPEYPRRVWE